MRAYLAFSLLVAASSALAQVAPQVPAIQPSGPPYEVVKDHIDLEVNADGSFLESREVAYRVLSILARDKLQQTRFSYTDGFQSIEIRNAYTLKADGTRLDVADKGKLSGSGVSSAPGFEDIRTKTVVFPNLEVGDEVVVTVLYRQTLPWFPGQFAQEFFESRTIAARDTQVSITAPSSMKLFYDVYAMAGGDPVTEGGKVRRTWTYHNDIPLKPELEAVSERDDGPHIAVSTFADFAGVAATYNTLFQEKAKVTPEIQALADRLTAGVSDRREQARLLYEWVSTHISYVNIVLGAGGFVPHSAASILETRYGDCKDHVMILGALLAAKGIPSSPVLINAGGNSFKLPGTASPFLFDHLITYVPEFHLYLDSTARVAPFGVLPVSDAGKPVVQTVSGTLTQTPVPRAADSIVRSKVTVTIAPDGSASGDTQVEATGTGAILLRGLMGALPANSDPTYLRLVMGAGADGSIDRGDTATLSPRYTYSVHFRETSVANFPGPGALPADIGYNPYSFSAAVAGSFPPSRMRAFACSNGTAEEDLTINLPPGTEILALPRSGEFEAQDQKLTVTYENRGHGTIHETIRLAIDHPAAVCTADSYNRARKDLTKMISALKAQILFK